jgi:hypothetical protein
MLPDVHHRSPQQECIPAPHAALGGLTQGCTTDSLNCMVVSAQSPFSASDSFCSPRRGLYIPHTKSPHHPTHLEDPTPPSVDYRELESHSTMDTRMSQTVPRPLFYQDAIAKGQRLLAMLEPESMVHPSPLLSSDSLKRWVYEWKMYPDHDICDCSDTFASLSIKPKAEDTYTIKDKHCNDVRSVFGEITPHTKADSTPS